MSNTQYKTVARRFVEEIFNERKTEAAKNFVTPDIVYHGMAEEVRSLEDFKKWVNSSTIQPSGLGPLSNFRDLSTCRISSPKTTLYRAALASSSNIMGYSFTPTLDPLHILNPCVDMPIQNVLPLVLKSPVVSTPATFSTRNLPNRIILPSMICVTVKFFCVLIPFSNP